MPEKPRMKPKLIKLPPEDFLRLRHYAEDMALRSGGVKFSMNDAVRLFVRRGLDEYDVARKAEGGGA